MNNEIFDSYIENTSNPETVKTDNCCKKILSTLKYFKKGAFALFVFKGLKKSRLN